MQNSLNNYIPHAGSFADVICLSHLRWDFVFQRPHHLMSRFARSSRVFFFEEPIFGGDRTHLEMREAEDGLFVLTPRISESDRHAGIVNEIQRGMLDSIIDELGIKDYLLWFYTPMAMGFADHLKPKLTVFDCMDELSAFKFAPPELILNERRLINLSDVVFTGGQSLYEAKRNLHPRVFAFPSSIDVEHFRPAREIKIDPPDQIDIKRPRFGFCGVIDERFDAGLMQVLAELRPDWQFIIVGPVVKISEDELPKTENIHYLGGKNYKDLPKYFAGWDVALMPFAMNESTKFISPTKTPEYLAAGLPVISTPIRDVVRPYGDLELVSIAETPAEFVKAGESLLQAGKTDWLRRVDDYLQNISWDKTWAGMLKIINEEIAPRVAVRRQAAHVRT